MEQHCLIRVVQAYRQVQQVVFPGIAGSLAVGILLVSTVFRVMNVRKRRLTSRRT